jgi:hypothetical protein
MQKVGAIDPNRPRGKANCMRVEAISIANTRGGVILNKVKDLS